MALRTVTCNHEKLRHISLYLPDVPSHPGLDRIDPGNVNHAFEEVMHRQWWELDHLLAQLWESHSIRTKIGYTVSIQGMGKKEMSEYVGCLLPGVTGRGITDLVEHCLGPRI